MSPPSLRESPVVFVVDDDVSVRESLELLIRSAGWEPELFESAKEFLARPRAFAPSCLILDVNLPDLNGLDLQRRVASDRSDMPIIFITGFGDVPTSVQAMKGGAVEFLTKPFRDQDLLDAVNVGLARDRVWLEHEKAMTTLRTSFDSLTPREREVMASVVTGRLNKQIAADLGVSEVTVKVHRGQVMQKMRAKSLTELARMADKLNQTL